MRRISKYQAEDGKEFPTEAECHNYELSQAFIKDARKEYDAGNGQAVSMLILILNDPKPFRDMLNNYIRRMRKLISEEQTTLREAA